MSWKPASEDDFRRADFNWAKDDRCIMYFSTWENNVISLMACRQYSDRLSIDAEGPYCLHIMSSNGTSSETFTFNYFDEMREKARELLGFNPVIWTNEKLTMIPDNDLVLLCTVYSNPDPTIRKLNNLDACKMAGKLLRHGFFVLSPIIHSVSISDKEIPLPGDRLFWSKYNGKIINGVDCLFVLDMQGWQDSTGIRSEYLAAKEMDKKAYLIRFDLDDEKK